MCAFNELLVTKKVKSLIMMIVYKVAAINRNISYDELVSQAYLILKENEQVITEKWKGNMEAFCRYALRNHLKNYIRSMRKDALFHSISIDNCNVDSWGDVASAGINSQDLL